MTTQQREDHVEGSVELVLDDYELLIDLGERDGIEVGMRFVVLGKKDVETASGRTIGIEFPKVIVKIVRFEGEEFAVGRTFRTIKGRPAQKSLFDVARALGESAGTPDRLETIRTEKSATFESSLSTEDKAVHAGDRVRQTVGEEFLGDI